MAGRELILKHRMNPLLVLSNIMKGVSSRANKFLDESWTVFNNYMTYKFLKKNENRVKYAVQKAEELAPLFAKVIQEIPTDSMLEAAVLLYFILEYEGISKRYEDTLVRPALSFISRCIRDYNRGIATLESSPALSRCIGLSYIFIDKLSREYKKVLEELLKRCDEPESPNEYFCLYASFSSTLKAILDREEKDEVLCRRVANVSKSFSRYGTLETITLMLLTTGLSLRIGCRHEAISLKLFQKLAKVLETNSRTLLRRSRGTWQALSLALKLNKLEKLAYVPEGYIVLREKIARRIANILSAKKKTTENLLVYLSLIIGVSSLVTSIIATVIQGLHYISIMFSLIASSFLILVATVIYSEYREIQSLLDEPDIQKLLKEVSKG